MSEGQRRFVRRPVFFRRPCVVADTFDSNRALCRSDRAGIKTPMQESLANELPTVVSGEFP